MGTNLHDVFKARAYDAASASYGPQVLAGPILSLPYVEEYDEAMSDERGRRVERRRIERVARYFPATSTIEGNASVETKSRGLFKARVFAWRATMRGEFVFDAAAVVERSRSDSRIVWGKPTLGVIVCERACLERPGAIARCSTRVRSAAKGCARSASMSASSSRSTSIGCRIAR